MTFEELPVRQFVETLSSTDPTPGGGTAAAAAGAMGAALAAMVAGLTLGKEKFAAVHDALRSIDAAARFACPEFLRLIADDSRAYDAVVAARRLPKDTEEEKATRMAAIAAASRRATEVPMETARLATGLLARLPELAEKGNPSALSDAGVAALLLAACAEGALLNVGINLASLGDAELIGTMEKETAELSPTIERFRDQVIARVRKTFRT